MEDEPNYFLAAQKFWKTVVSKSTSPDLDKLRQQADLHKRLLNIFHAGNYYYYVFSMHITEFDLVSDNVKNILGYDPEELSLELFMDKVHPDDRPYLLNFEYKIVEFFKALPFEKVPFYKVQYDFRIKRKDGEYIRILHQAVQVDYDEENYYRTLSIDTDITHIKPEGLPCFSLIGLDGEPSFHNIKDTFFKKPFDLFTKREREILKGIIEGKTSHQIAAELFISIFTVNAHRRNIMKKAEASSLTDLISRAIKQGWI